MFIILNGMVVIIIKGWIYDLSGMVSKVNIDSNVRIKMFCIEFWVFVCCLVFLVKYSDKFWYCFFNWGIKFLFK